MACIGAHFHRFRVTVVVLGTVASSNVAAMWPGTLSKDCCKSIVVAARKICIKRQYSHQFLGECRMPLRPRDAAVTGAL